VQSQLNYMFVTVYLYLLSFTAIGYNYCENSAKESQFGFLSKFEDRRVYVYDRQIRNCKSIFRTFKAKSYTFYICFSV